MKSIDVYTGKEKAGMPDQEPPPPEHTGTYVVADSNQEELRRVHVQDQMLTAGMGGVLPEQPAAAGLRRVLDVGCGTGNWLIELAKAYPTMRELVGVDSNGKMVAYAQDQARAEKLGDRVKFYVMNVLRMLEFPDSSFDLVNQRLGVSYLRTSDWPRLLQEYQRVARAGGVVRIVENGETKSSPALTRFSELVLEALYQAGHLFTPGNHEVTAGFARLLSQHGLQQVQAHEVALEFRASTPLGQFYVEDVRHSLNTLRPFLEEWTRGPAEYQELCSQIVLEIQQPDFVATLQMFTVWGTVPPGRKK